MLSDLIRGYTVAAVESSSTAGRADALQDDLAAFSWAVRSNDSLRGALSDPSLPITARLGIVADLVGERVGAESAAVLGFAIRVTPTADVAETIAELAHFVTVDGDHTTSGRAREFLRGYAERVFEDLGESAALDTVEDELFSLARAIDANEALRTAFGDDSSARRVAVAHELLATKVSPASLRVVAAMLGGHRVRNLAGTLDWLVELVAEERGRRVASVRSAVPLSDDERTRLASALSRLTGRQVEARVIEDPDVLGGVLISVGDFMIDATVRLRLERLRDALGATA